MVSSLYRFHAASGDEKDAEKSTESNVYLGVSPLLYAYLLNRFLPNVSGIRPACEQFVPKGDCCMDHALTLPLPFPPTGTKSAIRVVQGCCSVAAFESCRCSQHINDGLDTLREVHFERHDVVVETNLFCVHQYARGALGGPLAEALFSRVAIYGCRGFSRPEQERLAM